MRNSTLLDIGTYFSKNPERFVIVLFILVFYLNLFLALGAILAGPFLMFHELPDVSLRVLFGVVQISGWSAAVYYLILMTIITLSFHKAIKEDGNEFFQLLKKALTISSHNSDTPPPPSPSPEPPSNSSATTPAPNTQSTSPPSLPAPTSRTAQTSSSSPTQP